MHTLHEDTYLKRTGNNNSHEFYLYACMDPPRLISDNSRLFLYVNAILCFLLAVVTIAVNSVFVYVMSKERCRSIQQNLYVLLGKTDLNIQLNKTKTMSYLNL